MKETGLIIKNMDKENLLGKMENVIQVIINIIFFLTL